MKRLLAFVAVGAAALALASSVAAVPPLIEPLPQGPIDLPAGFCSFPVHIDTIVDREKIATFFDKDGNVVRQLVTGYLVITLTNTDTGKSITVNNSGTVTFEFEPDGSIVITQHGENVTGNAATDSAPGFLVHNTGTIVTHAVFNPDTGFFELTIVKMTGHTIDLCAELS